MSPDVNFNTHKARTPTASPEEKKRREVKVEGGEKKEEEGREVEGSVEAGSCVCRHCKEKFHSPVSLHQHERYLCKQNKDIVQLIPPNCPTPPPLTTTTTNSNNTEPPNACVSPASATSMTSDPHVHHNNSLGGDMTTTTDDDDDDDSSDRKKYRMRSLISDDQQSALKAYYARNPRPTKDEQVTSYCYFQLWSNVAFCVHKTGVGITTRQLTKCK
jgi:hypothetical protein